MPTEPAGYYDKHASVYNSFADESFSWLYIERPAFDAYLSDMYRNDVKVLDIGCGGGRVSYHLTTQGISQQNITGIDPSIKMLAYAKARLHGTTFIQTTASKLPFKKRSFDLIVSNMVLYQMDSKELDSAVSAMSQVLRSEGVLFFVDTNPLSSDARRAHKNQWLTQQTPWGPKTHVFVHDFEGEVLPRCENARLKLQVFDTLAIQKEGRQANPIEYKRYSKGSLRIAARFQKQ